MLEALNLKNNAETRYKCQVSVYRTIGPLVTFTTGSPITPTDIQKRKYIEIGHFINVSLVIYIIVKPKRKGVCNNFIHLSSVSCLKIFLYLSVELDSKIISSTGCNIILSGDHEFPARAKFL